MLLDVIVVELRDRIRKLVVASSMSLYGAGAYRCPACGGSVARPRNDEKGLPELIAWCWDQRAQDSVENSLSELQVRALVR